MKNAIFSFLLVSALALACSSAAAQNHYQYQGRVPELVSPMQEKTATSLLVDLYPFGNSSVDAQSRTITFTSGTPVDRDQLRGTMAQYGLTLEALYIHEHLAGVDRWIAVGGNGFPVFEHTADPIADDARYDAQKQAWIQADPDLYRELTQAGGEMQLSDDVKK